MFVSPGIANVEEDEGVAPKTKSKHRGPSSGWEAGAGLEPWKRFSSLAF
jgi:hypothetical protein